MQKARETLANKRFTWEQYEENVRKVGCCPCGYIVHNYLSLLTHFDLHRKLGEVEE